MGLGTSLRFFYSEAKMVRKLRGSPLPGPQGGQHTDVSPTRLGPGGGLTMASPPFTAVGKNLGNKIASLNPVRLAAAQSSFLQNNSNYQIIIPDGSLQSENFKKEVGGGCRVVRFFFFFLLPKQRNDRLKLFIKWYLFGCFCFVFKLKSF